MEYTRLGYFTTVLSAEYLSNTMLAEYRRGGKNLNAISHDTAIDLINKVKALGINVKRVILDTVGQPHAYKALLERRLRDPNLEIIVESKADDTYPVVSAASICAKVTRDEGLMTWRFPETKEFNNNYGCGYPGDVHTKAWLRANMDDVFGFPTLVRYSWKTCYTILEDKKMNLEWFDKIEDPKAEFKKTQQKLAFK